MNMSFLCFIIGWHEFEPVDQAIDRAAGIAKDLKFDRGNPGPNL